MNYTIILSQETFRTMISAALEAYCVPHEKMTDPKKHKPLETTGTLWGYKSEKDNKTFYHLTTSEIDSSALRKCDSVLAKEEALTIKSGFFSRYSPELHYLGDFHTHPYSDHDKIGSADEVTAQKLYHFSKGDFDCVTELKRRVQYQIGIVTTVYKMKRITNADTDKFLDKESGICFTYTGVDEHNKLKSFRIWIKAYVFNQGNNAPHPDKHVSLICPTLGFLH